MKLIRPSTIGRRRWVLCALAATALALSASALASDGHTGFGFNATDISGFPTGAATLTGGGSYNPVSGFVQVRWRLSLHERRSPGSAYRVSRWRRRSLGHGRAPEEHELQVHRGGGGAS